MKIFITGATGFVGGALTARLQRDGHEVTAWVRSPKSARFRLGPDVELVPVEDNDEALVRSLGQADAVVNLAGDPLFSGRWTAAKKARMVQSRVGLTERVVRAMAQAERTPSVLVSASAIGIYGDSGDRAIDETAPVVGDYLGSMAAGWEKAAQEAEAHGVRVVIPRIGIVLGLGGGALAQMLPIFMTGGGGRLGSGRQKMSWILLEDLVEMIARALVDESYEGVYNATAPSPVTNSEFTAALGAALSRPAFIPVPGFALRLAIGEAAGVLLGGQHVVPQRLIDRNFPFRGQDLRTTLGEVLAERDAARIETAKALPDREYLRDRGATYVLTCSTAVPRPPEEVLDFFSHAGNLGPLTPGALPMTPEGAEGAPVAAGQIYDYRLWLGPLSMAWRTEIEAVEADGSFVDNMAWGPYSSWWHRHTFGPGPDGGTMVHDQVFYRVPLGPIGWVANYFFVAPTLRFLWGFRRRAMARRLGVPSAPVAATL